MAPRRFSEQIRTAVRRSGLSRYRICQDAEIDQGQMSRFMAGEAGLSLDTLDRLARVLGLEVVVSKPPKRKEP